VYEYCSFGKYCLGDEMKKNEMDGECGTYGEEEKCIQGFGGRGGGGFGGKKKLNRLGGRGGKL